MEDSFRSIGCRCLEPADVDLFQDPAAMDRLS